MASFPAALESVWVPIDTDRDAARELARTAGVSEITARLLLNRGIADAGAASAFLSPALDHLHDPMLLPDMERGVERTVRALRDKERILVHGDYDVDGVTSAALLVRVLSRLGGDVIHRLPHRKKGGYGIKPLTADEARDEGVRLIVTADCGVTACDTVNRAAGHGIDMVVTDHHEPGDALPDAVAVINPRRHDSTYPFPSLAGVGVALKFAQAVTRAMGYAETVVTNHFLDLVALGTIADKAPLTGENRIIARHGLAALAASSKAGLRALMSTAGLAGKQPTAYSVGFQLGPRINAAGRMADAALALELMLTSDDDRAAEVAEELDKHNRNRQQEQARVMQDVERIMEGIDLDASPALVVVGEGWHSGLIGIVAGRLTQTYHRPSIVFSVDSEKGVAHGSARSIEAFNMIEALNQLRDMLSTAGGHAMAAGLSLPAERLGEFEERLVDMAAEQIAPEDLMPRLDIDATIEAEDANLDLVREMAALEPFGEGNPEPLFVTEGLEVADSRRVGGDGQHLKLKLKAGNTTLDAIAFGMGDMNEEMRAGATADVCYSLRPNTFNGTETAQMTVVDIKTA